MMMTTSTSRFDCKKMMISLLTSHAGELRRGSYGGSWRLPWKVVVKWKMKKFTGRGKSGI